MTGKILVVDDDPHILYLLRIILRSDGFQVVTCQEEEKVLEIIKKEHPNLLILDILLPNINGWEICKKLRMDPETKDLPVMIMSSHPYTEKERLLAKELDVYDYLTKPFEPITILGKIKNLLAVPPSLRHLVKESQKETEIRRGTRTQKVEVLVVGGGIAGLAAAEACARSGAQVMLVNEWPFLGGEIVSLHQLIWPADSAYREEKFFHHLEKIGASRYSSRLKAYLIDPEGARKAAFRILKEYLIPFTTNTHLLDVMREGTTVKGVVVEGEKGPVRIETKIVIDSTLEGNILELAGIPFLEEEIEPSANVILGGINGKELEEIPPKEHEEIKVYPLPSLREAVILDVMLGKDWKSFFYEGIEETISRIKKNLPGCQNAYILRRPLHVMTQKKTIMAESFPAYGTLIPKTFEQILVAGWPLLKPEENRDALGLLFHSGKMAGILAGISVALNQDFRDISQQIIRDAFKTEGISS